MTRGKDKAMIRPFEAELNFASRLLDMAIIGFSFWLACYIQSEVWRNEYTVGAVIAGIVFYLTAQISGLYRAAPSGKMFALVQRVALAWGAAFLVVVLYAFASKTSEEHSRRVMMTWAVISPVVLSIWRVIAEALSQEAHSRGYNVRTTAIVGASALGAQLAQSIKNSPWMGLELVGFYDDRMLDRLDPNSIRLGGLKGNLSALVEAARNNEVDHVYIALPPRAEPRIAELVSRLSDTTASVHLAYDFGGFDLLRAQWSNIGDIPVMSVVDNPFYGVDGILKRVEDICIGSVILAMIAIPMSIIAIGVKLSSPGPVFFKQRRYGLNGEVVKVLKFRTMTVCEDGDNVVQATKGDQRITKFGGFLRRTSLDELPQFLQVVGGTMSIVGPRPHAVAHNEAYRSQIKGYMLRHKVKPGITGWAQVNGWRGETDTLEKMEKRVEYDLDYIRGWHLGFDLRIIFLTIRQVVMGHSNAY
ncbi:undecaprenyl-phosphate glucose phosphotransferase [Aurantivibrio plasticivorans]